MSENRSGAEDRSSNPAESENRSGAEDRSSNPAESEDLEKAFSHRPVMVDEVVRLFEPVPPGLLVDATVGGGGHARALLEALPQVRLLGLDRDADALEAASVALGAFGDRVRFRRARFDQLAEVVDEEAGAAPTVGVLFDLGASSPQFDRPERGFSYWAEGPLDMRMDRAQAQTAADVVNGYSEEHLTRVLTEYSDERFARRISRAIVAARPLGTTTELAEVVAAAIPAPARRRGGHPARRAFQAIRIEVNHELDVLPAALDQAIDRLVPGGRCVVLAYHSGEDRIVKRRFAEAETGGCVCPPALPCQCGAVPRVRSLRRGAKPGPAEAASNRRAQSARLRAVEKLGTDSAPPGAVR